MEIKIAPFKPEYIDEISCSFSESFKDWGTDETRRYLMNAYNACPRGCFAATNEKNEILGAVFCKTLPYNKGKMLLICPLVEPDFTKRKVPPPVTLKRDTQLFNSLTTFEQKTFQRFMVVQNRQNWERFKKEMVSGSQKSDQAFLQKIRKIKNYSLSFPVDSLINPYTKPVLILTGRQDALVGYKDVWNILDNYPRATFAVLDMAGHALQIEQQKIFASLVHEFLDRIADKK